MFITLLAITFLISLLACFIIARLFNKSIKKILDRLTEETISESFQKYIQFAIFVVGISSGVRIWELERYITPNSYEDSQILVLTSDRWVLEVYRTIIATLEGIAWMLLLFFIFALVAYVIVRIFESKKEIRNKNLAD